MNKNELSDMSPAKRQQLLLEELRQNKVLDVKDAARKFYFAEATVRRDLNKLAAAGLIRRTYGGAVLTEGLDMEIPLSARESQSHDKKDAICRVAADLIHDGDTVILDSSSTVARLIPFLKDKHRLRIITNGAKTAVMLAGLPDVEIYCTGGKMRENSLSYIGESALETVRSFRADILFFSCRALSEEGIFDASEDEGYLRRAMMAASRYSVLLIDSTKCHGDSFFRICGTEELDAIICDDESITRIGRDTSDNDSH